MLAEVHAMQIWMREHVTQVCETDIGQFTEGSKTHSEHCSFLFQKDEVTHPPLEMTERANLFI